jgi:hypothetical protein
MQIPGKCSLTKPPSSSIFIADVMHYISRRPKRIYCLSLKGIDTAANILSGTSSRTELDV